MKAAAGRLRTVLLAESLGTAALVAIVVGSGIMAERLSAGNDAMALLANAFATGCGLYVLIVVFAPVSGAHFNPLISMLGCLDGSLSPRKAAAYATSQCFGAITGTLFAHAMFGLPLFELGTRRRTGAGQLLGELVATTGLILTVRMLSRRSDIVIAATVGAYIAAAYWFTSSTAFANPAVTLARALTTTFAGIAPIDVPAFVVAQGLGAVMGYALSYTLNTR